MGRTEAKAGSGGCDLQVTWVRTNCMFVCDVCTFVLKQTLNRRLGNAVTVMMGSLDRKWCRIWPGLPIPEFIFLATVLEFRHTRVFISL